MTERVFIARDNTATFICPRCGAASTVDVARYAHTDKRIRVKANCKCGHRFEVILEKRRQHRKSVDLPGRFVYHGQSGEMDKGVMRVVDISSTGLKLKFNTPRPFQKEDILEVEFTLDDKRRTHIRKKVIVRNVTKNFVGVSFSDTEPPDPALGFYLLS